MEMEKEKEKEKNDGGGGGGEDSRIVGWGVTAHVRGESRNLGSR